MKLHCPSFLFLVLAVSQIKRSTIVDNRNTIDATLVFVMQIALSRRSDSDKECSLSSNSYLSLVPGVVVRALLRLQDGVILGADVSEGKRQFVREHGAVVLRVEVQVHQLEKWEGIRGGL